MAELIDDDSKREFAESLGLESAKRLVQYIGLQKEAGKILNSDPLLAEFIGCIREERWSTAALMSCLVPSHLESLAP